MAQQHLPKSFNWPVRLGSFSKRAEDLLHALLTISAVARDFAVHECELKLRELGFGDVFDTYDLIYTGKRKSSVKEKDRAQWKLELFKSVWPIH